MHGADAVNVIWLDPKGSLDDARTSIRYAQIGETARVVATVVNERLPDLILRVKRRQADMLVESKFDLHGNVIITVPFSQLTLYYRDCGLGHE